MSVIGDITGVIGLASKAMELADKAKNLELKEVIVNLKEKLIDLKEEIVDLREEKAHLTEELKRATSPPEVTLKNGHYYKGDDGPFCTTCYDSGGKLVRLADASFNDKRLLRIQRRCHACKATYVN